MKNQNKEKGLKPNEGERYELEHKGNGQRREIKVLG